LKLAIDASSLIDGGGLTHIKEILNSSNSFIKFDEIHVFGSSNLLDQLPSKEIIHKHNHSLLDKSLFYRSIWKLFRFERELRRMNPDVLLIPSSIYFGSFRPYVAISQNLLPFEFKELIRYKFSIFTLKLLLIRFFQKYTFRRASGVIFLTNYSKNKVLSIIGDDISNTTVIPHGFRSCPNQSLQKNIKKRAYFNLLYVSRIDVYKHQRSVAKAVFRLNEEGIKVRLTLVGPSYKKYLAELSKDIEIYNSSSKCIEYIGPDKYENIDQYYLTADGFIFASSCENQPIILLEAMSFGLPIASSSLGPMPEVLGENAVYFNPYDFKSTKKAILDLVTINNLDPKKYNLKYSWSMCANDTFSYLSKIGSNYKY